MTSKNINNLAKIIWDYHHVNHKLEKSDIIFCLCSHDLRVADYIAELYKKGYAQIIVFSGGIAHSGDLIETPWEKPEAEIFRDRAVGLGVPENNIIIENKATNCGENVSFTEKILSKKGIDFNSLIAVQKPYMERRTYATLKLHWPNKRLIVTSPQISFEDYCNKEISEDDVINIMVGDLQRIKLYYEKGYQIYQEIPNDVNEVYEELIELGYNKHLI